jgi:tetratricopeptide (TPR) repeat protein
MRAWLTTPMRDTLRASLWLAVLVGSLCAVSLALADDAAARTKEQARAHYEQGAQLYEAGRYLEAVQAFEQAYALSHAKPLLFNIAQAYRLVGPALCDRALAAYQRYLQEDPRASNRAEVEERIRTMQSCVETQQTAQAGRTQPAKVATNEPARAGARALPVEPRMDRVTHTRPSRVLPLSLIVGGSLVALGGVGLYTLSRVEYEDAEASCPCPEGKYTRWERLTRASYGLAAVGGTTLASGLVWLGALRTNRYSLGIAPWRVRFTGRF